MKPGGVVIDMSSSYPLETVKDVKLEAVIGVTGTVRRRPDDMVNLDRATGEEVLGLLDQLVSDLGKTIVMVTHDPKAAARAHRMVHLEKGVLVDEAPA